MKPLLPARSLSLSLALAACCTLTYAAPAVQGARVIPVNNGINTLKLQGQHAMAVRAWRENFNAHGFDVVTMYVQDGGAKPGAWNIVPVFDHDAVKPEHLEIVASGGADCMLRDFRLVSAADGKSTSLVTATRDMGDSYADAAKVRFDYYVLTENDEGSAGHPRMYFEWKSSRTASRPYCDVNDAFRDELHLGPTSGQGGAGGE
ncbi:carbapenem self-resistance protein CarG family protein [Paraburkholderia sp. J67]|uniref:carbapenem self-resistance protein CarG family protein n=1 Tax=Paraburkholderia sp. J67 TaxID=2805435 RepID=UPI002ABE4E8A|nr:hypothetical protein [Paraburkholderia sp. J67]